MCFGENLKKLRGELGLTQEELARRISISPQAVSKWERGESMPDATVLPTVADALGVSMDRLFGRERESARDLAHHIRAFINGEGRSVKNIRRIAHLALWNTDFEGCSHRTLFVGGDGYVIGNNDPHLPFLCEFEEPETGWRQSFTDPDAYRKIFAGLAAPGVIEAIFTLSEYRYITFDEAYAENTLGIGGEVLSHLCSLGLLGKSGLEINGEMTTLYRSNEYPVHIALFIIAAYIAKGDNSYDYNECSRTVPLLR